MWEKITADPQANSISIGDLIAKNNPTINKDETIFSVADIERDGKLVLKAQSGPRGLADHKEERIDSVTKKYPTELIDEKWWLKTS